MAQKITRSIIVKASLDEVFNLWSSFENFPHFMKNLKSVKKVTNKISEWTLTGPLGVSIKWTAEMTRNEQNKRISWNTKDNAGLLTTSGQVTFNSLPHDETEITIVMQYQPAAGKAGEAAAQLLADPEGILEEDLRNFKAFAEGMYDRTEM
ncbi:MAG: SRPBCC family protein [Anaerolineae bacterium]|nr:SRPBCC family protein [Anaerolineae bacterium]